MAQGFVTTANLKESESFFSDSAILDNLYGEAGISSDIRLFNGNLGFKSILTNNINVRTESKTFGNFIVNKRYQIIDLGIDRDWTSVGWVANQDGHGENPQLNDIFTATQNGSDQDGIGSLGFASELVAVREFNAVFDEEDGWTIFVVQGIGRTAFTTKTLLSIDGGTTYNYQVVNSDGKSRFQIALSGDPNNIWDLDSGAGAGNVDDLTLVRKDTLTVENIKNAHVTPIGNTITLAQLADPEFRSTWSPDPFGSDVLDQAGQVTGTSGGIISIRDRLSLLESKKEDVVLTYQNNSFVSEDGIRFDGMFRITNEPDAFTNILKIGIDTRLGELYVGQKYEITEVGTSLWNNAGANTLSIGVQTFDLTTTSATQNKVYKIMDFGYSSRGNQDPTDDAPLGGFRFSVNDIDTSTQTIQLNTSGDHNLQNGDQVRYNDDGSNTIPELTDNSLLYVKRIDAQKVQITDDENLVSVPSLTPPGGGFFTLKIDTTPNWNALSGQTNVPYSQGSFFKAVNLSAASDISGAKIAPAIFNATAPGNDGLGADVAGGGLARVVDGNGLYIRNPANGEAKRAFTGTDNPWSKEAAESISIAGRSAFYQYPNGDPLPGVNSGLTTLTTPVLKTSSDVAQAGNFIFERNDPTIWDTSPFIVGETYTITELGNGRDWTDLYDETDYVDMQVGRYYVITSLGTRDWQYITQRNDLTFAQGDTILVKVSGEFQGGTGGLGYEVAAVGMSFLCTGDGVSSSGSGGKAIGEPKLLYTNDAQTALDGDGLENDGTYFDARANDFTHKIPVTINGDQYFLLAIYEYDEIPYSQLATYAGQEVIIQNSGSQRDWIAIGSDSQVQGTQFTVNNQVAANTSQGSGGTVTLASGSGTYKVLTTAT